MKPRKKRKRNSLAAVLCRALLAVVLVSGAASLHAADKKEGTEAIIAGTVFQSSGHLLRGAKVEIAAQHGPKIKRRAVSDAQGDFAVRVPAGRGTYLVTATAKGFQDAKKTVEIYESEKVRTNLMLSPRPKK